MTIKHGGAVDAASANKLLGQSNSTKHKKKNENQVSNRARKSIINKQVKKNNLHYVSNLFIFLFQLFSPKYNIVYSFFLGCPRGMIHFVSLHCTASGKELYFSFGSFNFLSQHFLCMIIFFLCSCSSSISLFSAYFLEYSSLIQTKRRRTDNKPGRV
jgi:hypothetical protein